MLEFVQVDPVELASGGSKWQILGYVQMTKLTGSQDPLSAEVKASVRPKACELGGEAVALSSGLNTSAGYGASIVSYAVLRPRPAKEAAPTKF